MFVFAFIFGSALTSIACSLALAALIIYHNSYATATGCPHLHLRPLPTLPDVRPFCCCHLACTHTPARPCHVLRALALAPSHTHSALSLWLAVALSRLHAVMSAACCCFFNFGFIRFSVLSLLFVSPPTPLSSIDCFGCFAYSSISLCVCERVSVYVCVWNIMSHSSKCLVSCFFLSFSFFSLHVFVDFWQLPLR